MATYKLFNQSISFPDSAERFFDMQYRTWKAMDSASIDFNTWYKKCGDIYTVLKGYEDKAADIVIKYANTSLFADLTSYEIYDVSKDSYDDECLDLSNVLEAWDAVADKYNEIIAEQAAEEEYRAERKANRARVVGGGFGVGGALKGMAAAGAMNAISGAGHGLVNAIGNAGSALAASSSKKALYSDEATCRLMRNAITSDILSCFNAHIHLLNNRLDAYIVSAFDSDKADALFENAKKVTDKQKALLIESFKNCPWDEDLLEFIFVNYKDERKGVWETAKRFKVDLSETAEQAFANCYTKKARESEEEAQAVKKDILAQMQELGIKTSKTIDCIELDGLNRIMQSYEPSTSETREKKFAEFEEYDALPKNKTCVIREMGIWELAKKYSVSFTPEKVEEILDRYYPPSAKNSEEAALKARDQILSIMKELKVSSSNVLDSLERGCMDRICKNCETANEETCNKMIETIKNYTAQQKIKDIYLKKVQVCIEKIWSKEDGEVFDNVYLNTDILNKEEVRKSLAFIKEKGRTASASKYISALNNCNAENIKKAREFLSSTTKLIMYAGYALVGLGIIFLFADLGFILSMAIVGVGIVALTYYYSRKKIFDILTINGTIKHKTIYNVTAAPSRQATQAENANNQASTEETKNDQG